MDSRPYCWILASQNSQNNNMYPNLFQPFHVSAKNQEQEVKTKLSKSFLSVGDFNPN